MMVQKMRRWSMLMLACLYLLCTPFEILAATKPINSVSVKVSSNLEVGNSLPEIQIGSGTASKGSVIVSQSGSHYTVTEAEWVENSKEVNPADEPRMRVVLEPDDVSEYYFLASYKESNVKVSGGTFVSARREGDSLVVTLRVKAARGNYDSPKDAYWNERNLGEARWEQPESDSGYYELQLYRDGKSVHKVSKTSSRTYNFYPYMTKEGDYTFRVRTIPGTDTQKKYGKNSDWLESGELQITDRYVSDGKGQQNANPSVEKGTEKTVGWFKEGNIWRYRYPNGNLCQNGWAEINSLWYYFDGNGNMLTGWQQVGGEYYYLHNNGQMALGWNKIDDKWYFFRTEEEYPHPTGTMVSSGWRIIGPYYYYFNTDGSIFTGWLQLNGKLYYLNTLDNSLQGAMFTGWIRRDNKTYFADSNGEIMQGWCKIDDLWYYFYPGSGEMAHDTQIEGMVIGSDGVWRE